ncbi:MAG: SDR family oxidoreductase [bacterium]
MHGKMCVVTGANSGIGKATALELAKRGALVVMVCRDRRRGEQANSEIIAKSGNKSVDLMLANFASQNAIHKLARAVKSKYARLDVLVNNAGIIMDKLRLTEDGIETTFAVNHLGYFLLTNLLLDLLKTSAPSRIVNVASDAHRGNKIDFDDLNCEKRFKPMEVYGRSKLANIMFTYALARRLEGSGVTANCLHPGVVATNFGHTASKAFHLMFKAAKPFLLSSARGAETQIYLATSEKVETISGKYIVKKQAVRSSEISYDETAQKRLWEVSERLVKIAFE